MLYSNNQDTEAYWTKIELEKAQDEIRQRDEDEQRRREERQRQWDEERYISDRSANTWPEAFMKQARLAHVEVASSDEFAAKYPEAGDDGGDYFRGMVDGCNEAYEIWHNREEAFAARRASLLAQLEQLDIELQNEVADELRNTIKDGVSKDYENGFNSVASVLEEDEDKTNWLNW